MSNFSALNDSNVELIIEPRKNDTNKIYPGRVIQPTQTTRSVDVQSRSANSIGSYKPIQVSKPLFYQRPSYQQSYYSSCGSSSHCPPKPCPPKPVHGSTGPTGPTGANAEVPIQIYHSDDNQNTDFTEQAIPSQSVIMYGNENDLTSGTDLTLPHWTIVGNTTVYYLYNQQPTVGGIDMTVLAPTLGATDPIQMNFQGDTTYQTDSTTLTIPPQGTATVVIMAQNYTVM